MKDLAITLATFARIGYLKPAPGTWGSAAAVPCAWALHQLGGFWVLLLGCFCVFIVGLWATQEMTRGADEHDPGEIVIDEVAGQWIAILPVSFGAQMMGIDLTALWPGLLVAFLGFRLFDIWKPLWIGKADQRGDAMGVMLDDVIAGIFAAILVIILAAFAHLVLM